MRGTGNSSVSITTMKSLLSLLVFTVAVSQISAAKLNITIFYETLSIDSMHLFNKQVFPTMIDPKLREQVYVELVPFGNAKYTKRPWSITCEHGPEECFGNVMNACFMAKHSDYWRHIDFVTCCFSDPFPTKAGEKCAQHLNYDYEGVHACIYGKEGIDLQIKNGRRTLDFVPKITSIPTIVYDNVYNEKDQKESLTNFRAVVLRKLNAKELNL